MSLPIIDIESALSGNNDNQQKVARQVDQVCRETGIFGIVGHGLSAQFMAELFASMSKFFALPLAQKQQYVVDRVAVNDYDDACPYGYAPMKTENQSAFMGRHGPPDLIERLSTGRAILDPDKAVPIPSEELCPGLRQITETFYRSCQRISLAVGQLFALAVGLPDDFFTSRMTRADDALRLNAYPSQHEHEHDLAVAEHTDATLFTLVSQDRDGLMMRDRDGRWQLVEVPSIDVLVVNIGDLMMRWTNDEWISTEHKVHLTDEPRLSTTYFKVVDSRTPIEVIPQFCADKPARYEPTDFSRFITEKLNRLFLVAQSPGAGPQA